MSNNELIKQYLEYDDLSDCLAYAKGEIEYGRFIPELFRIEVDMNEATERFHSYYQDNPQVVIDEHMVKTNPDCFEYVKFFQTYDHELFHFFQAFSMPMVFKWAKTLFESLHFEMSIMFRNIDNGGNFSLGRYNKFSQMLEKYDSDCKIDEHNLNKLKNTLKDISIKYHYYVKGFHDFYDGISLLYIFESMAYFASLTLPKALFNKDVLGLENQPKYTYCYQYFIDRVSIKNQEKYSNYLIKVFVYICYFSCKAHNEKNIDSSVNVSIFIELCKMADVFFKIIEQSNASYKNKSANTLKSEFHKNIVNAEYFEDLDQEKIVELFAIFDLASYICSLELMKNFEYSVQNEINEHQKHIKDKSNSFHILSYQTCNLATSHQIDFDDIFLLAKILIIPNFFQESIPHIYLDLKEDVENFEENYDEDEFLNFVIKCKFLLNEQYDVFCCEKHGIRNNRKQILHCKEQNSLACNIQELYKKPAYELFKI